MRLRQRCGYWLWLLHAPLVVSAQTFSPPSDDLVADPVVSVAMPTFVFTQSQFDAKLPRLTSSSDGRRAVLETALRLRLRKIDEHCTLTDAQLMKLHLAVRIEVAQMMADHDRFKACYVNQPLTREELLAANHEMFRQLTVPFHQLGGPSSLLIKVLRQQATAEQWQRYEVLDHAERSAMLRYYLHEIFSGATELSAHQMETLTSRMLTKYPDWKPLPSTVTYARYVLILAVEDVTKDADPLLSPSQQAVAEQQAVVAHRIEPTLRKYGLWPLLSE